MYFLINMPEMILTHFTVSLTLKCSLLIFDAFLKRLSLIVWVWRQRWQWRWTVVLRRWMDSNRLLTPLNLLSIKWQGKPHQEVKLTIWGELFIQFFKMAKYSMCFLWHCFMDDAQIQKRIPSHQILTLRAQHQYGHIISLCVINDYVPIYQSTSQTQQPTHFSSVIRES